MEYDYIHTLDEVGTFYFILKLDSVYYGNMTKCLFKMHAFMHTLFQSPSQNVLKSHFQYLRRNCQQLEHNHPLI